MILWRKDRQKRRAFSARAVLLRPNDEVSDSARRAIDLVRRVVALAEFLAARGVAVVGVTCDYGAFGCWSLQLQNGAEVFWDGMSFRLSMTWPGRKEVEVKVPEPGDPVAAAQDLLAREVDGGDSTPMALASLRPLATFAESLAAEDVAVAALHCHWNDLWWMDLRNGTTYERNIGVVRVIWKGQERNLSVAASPVERYRSANQFKTEFQRTLGETEDPIEVAGEYLTACLR